jgi:CubicO group peptidase (beta-lactamase class C family)
MVRHILTLVALLVVTGCAATQPRASQSEALNRLHGQIASGEIPNVHSVIAVQRGRRVVEWYFAGEDEIRGHPVARVRFEPDTLHDIRSATKSVVSILFGIAVQEGAIPSLDRPALDYFPEYADLQTPDRRRILLRHLLSMTSGMQWDESTYPYTDARNSETAMDLADDRLRFVLSRPIEAPPGARWRYSGGDVALIGAVIERATGMSLTEYAQSRLFQPLGIERFEWLQDDRGMYIAASGLRLTPRDMAAIGEMMLENGRHGGRQILAPEWVAASTAAQAIVDTGPGCGTAYGYFWWIGPACAADVAWSAAIGNGGQRIFIVPERQLVIVITAGLYNQPAQRRVQEITSRVIGALSWGEVRRP